jgi:hypothetical protein
VDIKNTIGVEERRGEESCIIKCPLTVAVTIKQSTSIVIGSFVTERLTEITAVFKSVE